jgi:hypothetical protein
VFRADVVVLEQPRLLLGRDDHLRAFTVRRVTLAKAEAETGVSRSALRSWYRNGEIQSRLVDGPNGPQRLVQLGAVIERAAASPRIQRRRNEKSAWKPRSPCYGTGLTSLSCGWPRWSGSDRREQHSAICLELVNKSRFSARCL